MLLKSSMVLAAVISLTVPGALAAQARINPADIIGTWQLMTRKNLRTGVVDSVANRRLAWEGFTQNTYHVFEMDLTPSGTTREELRALPALERQHRHLEAVHYVGRGGMYELDGHMIHFRRVISLDPNEIGTTPTAIVDSVTATTMFRRTVPDSTGLVTEQVYRRVR
jgi:hypothetical protein